MPTFRSKDLEAHRARLVDGMTDYMKGDGSESSDVGYSQEHIDRCMSIVDGYLTEVTPDAKLSEDQIRAAVKKAVLDLNQLNETCGGSLIETDQRETICALLLISATNAGLKTQDDITEEWRDW
jgi:hypothetical protein